MEQIVKEVGDGVKALRNEYIELSSMVTKINAMNNTMEKLLDEQTKNSKENDKINDFYQNKIDKIFKVHQLKFSEYEETGKEPRKDGRVTKWVNVRNKGEEFAFKSISEKEDQRIVQNQVTILKELHDFQNVIRFYGITNDGNKWYLVTEWTEYGNLREY